MAGLVLLLAAAPASAQDAATNDQARPALFSEDQIGREVAAARDWLEVALVDYESARLRDVRVVLIMPNRRNPRDVGLAVCGLVNARNRMGGYTGFKVFYHATRLQPPMNGVIDGSALDVCSRANRLNQTDYTAQLSPGSGASQ